jgi:hypothetical protein
MGCILLFCFVLFCFFLCGYFNFVSAYSLAESNSSIVFDMTRFLVLLAFSCSNTLLVVKCYLFLVVSGFSRDS